MLRRNLENFERCREQSRSIRFPKGQPVNRAATGPSALKKSAALLSRAVQVALVIENHASLWYCSVGSVEGVKKAYGPAAIGRCQFENTAKTWASCRCRAVNVTRVVEHEVTCGLVPRLR